MSEITVKHYNANSAIAVSIVLKSKKSMHVSFTPLSNGTSVFATSDPDIQAGLEKHYKFGKLFKLASTHTYDPEKLVQETAEAANQGDVNNSGKEATVIKVNDLQEAKDYIADTFGVSRTALKTKKSVLDAAAEHNIAFEGL